MGRTWGGWTRGGSTEGRIDRYTYSTTVLRCFDWSPAVFNNVPCCGFLGVLWFSGGPRSNSLKGLHSPIEPSRGGPKLCHACQSRIPAHDRVFHIFNSRITIARRCDRSPTSRNIFILKSRQIMRGVYTRKTNKTILATITKLSAQHNRNFSVGS